MRSQNSKGKTQIRLNRIQMYNSKRKSFYFLFVLLTFGFSLFPFSKAHAATPSQVIRVSPVIIHMDLSPNKTTTYTIRVENLLSTPLPVRVVYSNFDTTEEDGGYILTDTSPNSLASWIHLDKQELIIPAKTKQTVSLTIKTPQTISLGGYYGLLFFQPLLPQASQQTVVSAQVGVLLLGDIGVSAGKDVPGEILSFELPHLSQSSTLPLLLRVKNTSLNFFTAKPILTIKPLFGEAHKQFLEEKIIFPGKIRRWELPLTLEKTGIGIYTLTMQVSAGSGRMIETSRFLIIFPWIPVLSILAVIIVLLWSMFNRKKLNSAWKAFFAKE